ncbi:hypothetical protein GCM10008992_31580 [Halorubrum aquaticum]
MINSHLGGLFASILSAMIPAQIMNDSPFSFGTDDAIMITIASNRRIVTADTDRDKEASE